LLENRAAQYDKELRNSKSNKGRKVNQHNLEIVDNGDYVEFVDHSVEEVEDDFPENVADMKPDQFLSVNVHKCNFNHSGNGSNGSKPRPMLPKSIYLQNAEFWRNADYDTVKALSEYCNRVDPEFRKEKEQYSQSNSGNRGFPRKRDYKTNLHHQLWSEDDDYGEPTNPNQHVQDDESTQMIDQLSARGRHPGDVRQLLAINQAKQTPSKHSESKNGEVGDEFTLNGDRFSIELRCIK